MTPKRVAQGNLMPQSAAAGDDEAEMPPLMNPQQASLEEIAVQARDRGLPEGSSLKGIPEGTSDQGPCVAFAAAAAEAAAVPMKPRRVLTCGRSRLGLGDRR